MQVHKLYAVNFRNYASCALRFHSRVNVFFGANAQGKTNLLEALFYSSFGFSHRSAVDEELVKMGCADMGVGVEYENFSGLHNIKIKKYSGQERARKEIFLDGVKVRPREHYGVFNSVMFSPEDLQLVKGEPSLRRRFFDMQIAQADSAYFTLLSRYNRVLQQRNKLLKEIRDNGASGGHLKVWDEEFIHLAAQIASRRIAALTKLRAISAPIYTALAGQQEKLTVQYELKANNGESKYPEPDFSAWEDFYAASLRGREKVDILRGSTGVGPHRDDILFLLNDVSMKAFASQGQQRSCALALKFSQLEYVRRETGEYPVLLLDDVMSELDGTRRAQLLEFLDGRVQTFITVNDRGLIPALEGNVYFEIVQGQVHEVN